MTAAKSEGTLLWHVPKQVRAYLTLDASFLRCKILVPVTPSYLNHTIPISRVFTLPVVVEQLR